MIDSDEAVRCYNALTLAKTARTNKNGEKEQRQGAVLDITRQLLSEGRDEKVLALVS